MAGTRAVKRTSVRKQPTQARSGAMVAAILQAAAELLDSGEPERYTTNLIAERAGASIGSLYQYFPSKDAITVALLAEASQRLMAGLEQASRLDDWRAALRAMIAAAVSHQLERPGLARMLDAHESRLAAADAQLRDGARIHTVLMAVLSRIPGLDRPEAVGADLIAITRALCDAAGERAEFDAGALRQSVERAIFGYLEWPARQNAS